jgi:hypothetical protein
MRSIVLSEAVDAQVPLFRVQLSGILKESSAPHAGFFTRPAFVANVPVAAAGIHRCEDPACFRRCCIGYCQPWPCGPVLC